MQSYRDAVVTYRAQLRRPPTPLNGAYCNAIRLAYWSVRQIPNCQFSSAGSLCTSFNIAKRYTKTSVLLLS